MVTTIKMIKNAGDCKKEAIHVEFKHTMWGAKYGRVIACGTKYLRILLPGGRIMGGFSPEYVVKIWK